MQIHFTDGKIESLLLARKREADLSIHLHFFFFFSMTEKRQQTLKDILSNKKLREHNSYVEVPALGAPEGRNPRQSWHPHPSPLPTRQGLARAECWLRGAALECG